MLYNNKGEVIMPPLLRRIAAREMEDIIDKAVSDHAHVMQEMRVGLRPNRLGVKRVCVMCMDERCVHPVY